MQSRVSNSEKSALEMKKAKEEYEVLMARERSNLQNQLQSMQTKQVKKQAFERSNQNSIKLFITVVFDKCCKWLL